MRLIPVTALLVLALAFPALAQPPEIRHGTAVPHEVRQMYERGLEWLAANQGDRGDWTGAGQAGQVGPGITGLCLMTLLASGEDPNFGPYSRHVRKALRSIMSNQDATSGCIGPGNMYHHGFAMLGLAEAYGAVDDRNLWTDDDGANRRTVGQALELAVRGALASQRNNPFGAWRYSPNATDADTSVSGAVFVGLLAARNAGIEVPDESIERALTYYR
ncbi:MAG: squalene--hopene cyclase, partial [Candidatus Saccharimonadales bacterium]